jgi:alcohol dehydrogenase YqhD (iron-dependent ADH family)
VLTISAAGSEGSDSIVITQEDGNLKWGAPKCDLVRPVFSILDPSYTCSLPPYQTASGSVDMMAHILERYFTNTKDVALTDRLAEGLLKTIAAAATKALKDPQDYSARADLMWAGMLAHNNSVGIGRAQDWASHQMEHELSAFYDCAHGAGLAVMLPAWMRYVMPHDPMRFARFAVEVFGCEMDFSCPETQPRKASNACGSCLNPGTCLSLCLKSVPRRRTSCHGQPSCPEAQWLPLRRLCENRA